MTYVTTSQPIKLTKQQMETRIIMCDEMVESMKDESQIDNFDLEDMHKKSDSVIQTIADIMNNEHEVAKLIIQNLNA